MFAECLNMRQYDERRHYQSARVSLTKWLLRRIIDKWGLAKETEIEEYAPLKYTTFDRVRVMEIFDGILCFSCKYYQRVGLPCRHLLDVTQDLKTEYCELRWWRGLSYYARQDTMFLVTFMKELQRVSPGIPFHEETAPAHFPVFWNCVSTRDFYLVLNSLKPVVVGEEVQCFYFHLPRDIEHKPMDARILTNVDEEGGQENSTSVYSENLNVFKDACNIAEINIRRRDFLAERKWKSRKRTGTVERNRKILIRRLTRKPFVVWTRKRVRHNKVIPMLT
jgi:hypothetical protein